MMLRGTRSRAESADKMLCEHFGSLNNANQGYVAWSGGKDSTTAVHLAIQRNPNIPIVFFDSGLEYPETIDYINENAQQHQLNFHVIPAVPDALTILEKTGLWTHDDVYDPETASSAYLHNALITIPAAKAHQKFGSGEVSGMRADESRGRAFLLRPNQGAYIRAHTDHVVAPLWNWNQTDVDSYLTHHNIPPNPVYAKLKKLGVPAHRARVGLAFDANGLEFGRATWLRMGWPQLWGQLQERLPRINEWR